MSAEYPIFGKLAPKDQSVIRIDESHDSLQKAIADAEKMIERSKKLAEKLKSLQKENQQGDP
jgi:hypothetical protein